MTATALMKTAYSLLIALIAVALLPTAVKSQPASVPKTNPMKVYMHYMPWFETPATLGPQQWGFHWKFQNRNPNNIDAAGRRDIASHYYPKIGPYASSDPNVIEYHLLLMKLSGIDGVMLDWYGVQGTNGDIGRLLANSNALINELGDFGLEFGVVLEDRFAGSVEHTKANVRYLRDNYFSRPEYIRTGAAEDPLMMVFGPITLQQPAQWTEILAEAGEDVELLPLWYESGDAGANADGEFAWVYEDENLDNFLAHQSNFYRFRAPQLDTVAGVAFPGFHDFYEEGGLGPVVPFEIPHNDGQTLDSILDLVATRSSDIDLLQLATWNDFGEGTMFEPTVETGFDYLQQVQDFTGVTFGEAELELVYRLYLARKEYAGDEARQTMFDEVAASLTALEFAAAKSILDSAAPAGDYDGDGDVDDGDYTIWRAAMGTSTVLAGSGADGNFDGHINAADFTVWRDTLRVGGLFGPTANSVPEPSVTGWPILAAIYGFARTRLFRKG